ncbi:MAG TPA: hypothetical protein VM241_01175 [Candidatus Thermoplasmatota archaeon]|nr:hypothetical protein [Candidatus Thermoplasmatota archaeon]
MRLLALTLSLLLAGCLVPVTDRATAGAPLADSQDSSSHSFPSASPSPQPSPQPPAPRLLAMTLFSGSVTEIGPPVEQRPIASCGRAMYHLAVRPGTQEAWVVEGQGQDSVPRDAALLAWDQTKGMQCGGSGRLLGFPGDGSLTFTADAVHAWTWPVERAGDRVRFGNATLAAGEAFAWNATWTEQRTPTQTDGHNGTYTYAAHVEFRFLGLWPEANLHRLDSCRDLPGGC